MKSRLMKSRLMKSGLFMKSGILRAHPRASAVVLLSVAAVALGAGSAFAQTSVSSQQADQIALKALPGAALVHTSADHAQGTPVWDIHVSLNNQVWDVKVNALTGSVLSKRLSSEPASPSSAMSSTGDSSPDRAGGGRVDRSPDRAESSGAAERDGQDRQSFPSGPPSTGGVVFGQKTTVVPPQDRAYVNEALAKTDGTLKWVKFSRKDSSDLQMNIKIQKASGGTVKVKDVFNAQGDLISQRISGDS